MFIALATSSATKKYAYDSSAKRVKRFTASSPSPSPVAIAVRSQISCTAAMRGSVTSAAHSKLSPY